MVNDIGLASQIPEVGLVLSISGIVAQQDLQEQQPASQVGSHQEIFFHVLAPILAQLSGKFRVSEKIPDLVGASLHRMHQHSRELVNDLVGNASHGRPDRGLPFP